MKIVKILCKTFSFSKLKAHRKGVGFVLFICKGGEQL